MDSFKGLGFSMDISAISENMEKMEEKIKEEELKTPLDKPKSEVKTEEKPTTIVVVPSKKEEEAVTEETVTDETKVMTKDTGKFYIDANDLDKHNFFLEGEIVNIYENKEYLMVRVCPYKNSPTEYRPKPQVLISKKTSLYNLFKKENFQLKDAIFVKGEIFSRKSQTKEGLTFQNTAYFVRSLRRVKKQTNEDPFYDRFNLSASRVNKNYAICSGIVTDIKVLDNRIKFKLICKYGPKEDDVTTVLCHYMVTAHDYSILTTIIQGRRVAVTGSIHTDTKHTANGNIHFQDFVIDTVNEVTNL